MLVQCLLQKILAALFHPTLIERMGAHKSMQLWWFLVRAVDQQLPCIIPDFILWTR
jgi:hypothetical protein